MSPQSTNDLSSAWPPESLCTVKVSESECTLPVHARIRIFASPSSVFSTILDTSTFPRWNSWAPHVTVSSLPSDSSQGEPTSVLQKDTVFTLHVIMDASKPNKVTDTLLRVTDISTPDQPSSYVSDALLEKPTFTTDLSRVYRVAWSTEGGWPGLRSERFHEVIVLGGRECEVRTWECLGGVLARTVKWIYGKTLMEKFGVWLRDLKNECEKDRDVGEVAGMEGIQDGPGKQEAAGG